MEKIGESISATIDFCERLRTNTPQLINLCMYLKRNSGKRGTSMNKTNWKYSKCTNLFIMDQPRNLPGTKHSLFLIHEAPERCSIPSELSNKAPHSHCLPFPILTSMPLI